MTVQPTSAQLRITKLQRERKFVILMSMSSYLTDTALLFLYYFIGVIPIQVPIAYGITSLTSAAIFLIVHIKGWNLRLRDPNMVIFQASAGYIIILFFLSLAPQVSIIFILSIFIVTTFATLAMPVRQFIWSWIIVSFVIMFIMMRVGSDLTTTADTTMQQVVLILVVVSALGRVIYLNIFITRLQSKLRHRHQELKESVKQIEEMASTDELTKALNRRAIIKFISEEELRSKRSGRTFCIALLDIDHFKSVNDRYGHPVGDEVLITFVKSIEKTIRATDKIGRWGGEEFIVVFPETQIKGGKIILEKLLIGIEQINWSSISEGLSVTASAGLVQCNKGESIDELIKRSDEALYKAKKGGRNRLVVG